MSEPRTYLDHNATSPLRPEARAAMLAVLDLVGNPSSVHLEGRRARSIVEAARDNVAALVGARPREVVFTSGATEANTWALRRGGDSWAMIVLSAIEHDSVVASAQAAGCRLQWLPATADGTVDIGQLDGILVQCCAPTPTSLLTLQLANGETGVLQPVAEAAAIARRHGSIVHTDAVQAAGREQIDFASLGVDMMSLSAHKLGGPNGIGALVVRDGMELPALMRGGGQERRQRAGTENVAAIAGFGAAAAAALANLDDMARIRRLRHRLEAGIKTITPDAVIVGAPAPRLPGTSCIAVAGHHASALVIRLDLAGISIGAGSACSSGKIGGSSVLAAMAIPQHQAQSAIRISLGWSSTDVDVERMLCAWSDIHATRTGAPARLPHAMTVGD